MKGDTINWWIIGAPVTGILLTGIFNRYVIHDNPTHGTGRLINDLANHNYRLRGDLTYSPHNSKHHHPGHGRDIWFRGTDSHTPEPQTATPAAKEPDPQSTTA